MTGRTTKKRVLIRCRCCWVDVAIVKESEAVPTCPLCGKKTTYVHAKINPRGGAPLSEDKPHQDQETDDDGSTDPS